MNNYYVYITASKRNGALYTGKTNELPKRVWEHKHGVVEGFTKEHAIKNLVYYETHDNLEEAFKREKLIKRWRRKWKLELIEKNNPEWKDLYEEICK